MGGREVGGLANQLAAHMDFTSGDMDRVRRFWNAPNLAEGPGLKAVDLFEATRDGRVKALWIAATNPAASMPQAERVREALRKCPFVVVSDAWPTDTTACADLVLPAASWAEKDGTVTNSERRISRQRAFRTAPGAAKPDWWMFAEVARRMGWADAFSYANPAAIFREHAALSAFENGGRRVFDLGALATLDEAGYDALSPVQWPCPSGLHGFDSQRLFAQGRFPTGDGRARMLALSSGAHAGTADRALTLNTGRIRDQWHTMTRTGRLARLMTHSDAPAVHVHPRDATRRGIADGGLVRVETAHGRSILRASLDPAMRPGDVFVPMHWTDQFVSSGPIARLVHALTDPVSGQPDLKGTPATLEPVDECWRGVLLRCEGGEPGLAGDLYWSKVLVEHGFLYELSGLSPLAEHTASERTLRALLTAGEDCEIVSFCDPKQEIYRYAAIAQGKLQGCVFFAGPAARVPQAQFAKHLIGQPIDAATRLALLAGVTGDTAVRGRTVCACFSVDAERIRDTVRLQHLSTVEEVGAALRAGTNCGSCIPELKAILASVGKLTKVA